MRPDGYDATGSAALSHIIAAGGTAAQMSERVSRFVAASGRGELSQARGLCSMRGLEARYKAIDFRALCEHLNEAQPPSDDKQPLAYESASL